jgi:hypothetical protein
MDTQYEFIAVERDERGQKEIGKASALNSNLACEPRADGFPRLRNPKQPLPSQALESTRSGRKAYVGDGLASSLPVRPRPEF